MRCAERAHEALLFYIVNLPLSCLNTDSPDSAPQNILVFDPVAELGLTGGFGIGFPRFTALSSSQGARLDMSRARIHFSTDRSGGLCDRGGNRNKKPW